MSTYHSPGCQITGVSVMQGATPKSSHRWPELRHNNERPHKRPGHLDHRRGYLSQHTILQGEKIVAEYSYSYWLGNFPWRFTNFWHSVFKGQARDMVPGAIWDRPFLYKPSLAIQMLGPGGIVSTSPILPEFAVVEEDCYFHIGPGR